MMPVQVLGHSALQQGVERANIMLAPKIHKAGTTNIARRCSTIDEPYRHLTRDCATGVFNVLDFGIKGDGVTDDAPKMRALCGSNRTLLFPSGHTYYLATTVASNYPAYANAAFLCSQATNFHVVAKGAVFKIDPAIALSQAVLIDRGMHWTWDGGTIIHNRAGLTPTQENVGFGLVNNVDFRVSGVHFASGLGGLGGALVGDYNINGRISGIQMDGVGIGVDMAFSKNMLFEGIHATGADNGGLSDVNHVGDKFWSNIYDTPLAPALIVSAPVMTGTKILPLTSVADLSVGMVVVNSQIPIGTTISSIDISAKRITLSALTTGIIHPPITLLLKTSKISTVGNISLNVLSVTDVVAGMTIHGAGISPGTIITTINVSKNMLILSKKLLKLISIGENIELRSFINLNAQSNYTGYHIPDTENVSLINSDFS